MAALTIIGPGGSSGGSGEGEFLDVNEDGYVSPIDALMVINALNKPGFQSNNPGGTDPRLDVNHDNYVSPLDALLVINHLNAGGSGEGEGEASGLFVANRVTSSQPDLLASEPAIVLSTLNVAPPATAVVDPVATVVAPAVPVANTDWQLQIGEEARSGSHDPDGRPSPSSELGFAAGHVGRGRA